jgi:membrane protein DedA with SNARE-associated domain
LIGTFLEGETMLIAAGYLAHQGYLKFPWVIFFAFIGTCAGDQIYFFLGRAKGMDFLDGRPSWKVKSARVFALLQKHQAAVIIGFRFLYGFRTMTPFIIGASGLSPIRFIVFNFIGAAAWALAVGGLGFIFGRTVEVLLEEAEKYEIWVMALVFLMGTGVWLIHFLKKRNVREDRVR